MEIEMNNEAFVIDDDLKADWAVGKIKEAQEERDRLVTLAKNKIEELKMQIEAIEGSCESNTAFLKNALAGYMRNVKMKETKTQRSYKLISGSVVIKKPSIKYERDENALISWLESNGYNEFVESTKKAKWADFKRQVGFSDGEALDTETGMIIDGLIPVEEPERLEVK